jgi:diguanylate cyclase (GGDEF)-like protein
MLNRKLNKKKNLKMEDELYLLAYFDQLTQMPNEKYFFEELEKKINDDFENEERFAVVYLKINNLEEMHNILGFEKSSNFISYLAAELQKTNKKAELISLYKGNQFLLLYNLEQNLNLEKELENLLKKISKIITKKDYNYLLNVNLGTAVYPEHSLTSAGLLTKVHNAMYTMDTTADSFQIYDENIFLEKVKKESLKQDLQTAIEKKEFHLEFQPKVQTNNQRIFALEALIRWQHREKGLISPAEFIPLAEKTGLIKKIGIIVLREAFEKLKAWQTKRLKELKMCINISLIELNDSEIIKNIKHIADSYAVDNSLIEFEITERSFIELSKEVLAELKSMGFSIALDDFGTGYSSLSFLDKLTIDNLKLDKSFIDKITDERTKKLVAGVINISHDLDLKVVAEGVETKEQFEILKELNCDYIQGYYFYKPLPRAEVEKLLI